MFYMFMGKTLLAALAFTLISGGVFAKDSLDNDLVSAAPIAVTSSITSTLDSTSDSATHFTASSVTTKTIVPTNTISANAVPAERDGLRDALQSIPSKYATDFMTGDAYLYSFSVQSGIVKYELFAWSKDKRKVDTVKLIVSSLYTTNPECDYAPILKYFDKEADANCDHFRRAATAFMVEHNAYSEVNDYYRTDLATVLAYLNLYNFK